MASKASGDASSANPHPHPHLSARQAQTRPLTHEQRAHRLHRLAQSKGGGFQWRHGGVQGAGNGEVRRAAAGPCSGGDCADQHAWDGGVLRT